MECWKSFLKIKIVLPNETTDFVSLVSLVEAFETGDFGPIYVKFQVSKDYDLFIRSANFIIPAMKDPIVGRKLTQFGYPVKSSNSYINPKVWIEFMKREIKADFSLPVYSSSGQYFMEFPFSLYPPFTDEEMKETIARIFRDNSKSFSVVSLNQDTNKDHTQSNFICQIIQQHLCIVANFSSKEIKMINERCGASAEFLKSELSFSKDIKVIRTAIIPFFEMYQILDPKALKLFREIIISIDQYQDEFIHELEQCHNPFISQHGQIFIRSIRKIFLTFDQYSNLYPLISESFVKFSSNPENETILKEFIKSRLLKNKTVPSFLISPVQRIPRYQLFIERLLKSTPLGHPDLTPLFAALEELSNFKHKQNAEQILAQSANKFEKQMADYKSFITMKDNQAFIDRFDAEFEHVNTIVALFTDAVYIFPKNICDPKDILIFNYTRIRFESSGPTSFFLYTFKDKYELKFETENISSTFLHALTEAVTNRETQVAKDTIGLKWELVDSAFHKIIHHCLCLNQDKIWVFGGINSRNEVSNDFFSYSIDTNHWEEYHFNFGPSPRYDSVMVSHEGNLYLYGGKGLEEDLNDFWYFNIDQNEWEMLNVIPNMPGGPGLSMILHKGKLILSGGKDIFQTFSYDIRNSKWTEISINSIVPTLSYHSLVSYNGYVLLIGGITSENELSNKVYTLSLSNEWEYRPEIYYGIYPFGRYGHKVINYKDCVWVIGGTGSSVPFIMNQINQWGFVQYEGKFPLMLSHFGIDVNQNEIWIYGGISENGMCNGLYKVSIVREEMNSSMILRDILTLDC
ncbi:Kelch motif family protein [Histomonas meleagridis]|uniref:Kelch motif family protein n=1 Tax=Histomonas meleagridis TaxID=135588 RepID=UPI003559C7B0|nr:Kelch motif family protein [Histomonas meleagridis]KAH0806055.1 Kelch motif family protein [Histomonas meleagridis]